MTSGYMRTKIVELKGVSVKFNGLHAIEEINLEIEKGDFLGLLGPNGGGKSTLIKTILGLVENCCGTVKIFGETICHGDQEQSIKPSSKSSGKIGYIPQNSIVGFNNFPGTVYEVVSTGLIHGNKLFKRLTKDDDQKIDDTLTVTGIYDLKNQKVDELSGGQIQRVFISRGLVSDPQLLILDEPTNEVDLPYQEKFYSLLEDLNKKRNISIILSSHDINTVSRLVTKVACINKFLFFHEDPKKLFTSSDILTEIYNHPVGIISHNSHS